MITGKEWAKDVYGEETKPSNPKDVLGSDRVPLSMTSDLGEIEEALAMTEGAAKYGAYNYRGVGVRVSIYLDAAMRHLRRFKNGEDRDPKTQVHHLGYVRACAGIILESLSMGNLVDDRPPANPRVIAMMDEAEERVKHIKEMFKDKHPKHWTITDILNLAGEVGAAPEIPPQLTSEVGGGPVVLPRKKPGHTPGPQKDCARCKWDREHPEQRP